MVKNVVCAVLMWRDKVIRRKVFKVIKTSLNKEMDNSIVNGSSESLQGDAGLMEECIVITLHFTVNGLIDESKIVDD